MPVRLSEIDLYFPLELEVMAGGANIATGDIKI